MTANLSHDLVCLSTEALEKNARLTEILFGLNDSIFASVNRRLAKMPMHHQTVNGLVEVLEVFGGSVTGFVTSFSGSVVIHAPAGVKFNAHGGASKFTIKPVKVPSSVISSRFEVSATPCSEGGHKPESAPKKNKTFATKRAAIAEVMHLISKGVSVDVG